MKPRILFVAAEAIPLAKTGGLADVVTALALALRATGVDVNLLMPGYREAMAAARGLREVARFEDEPGLRGGARLLAGTMPDTGLSVTLLDMPQYFDRDGSLYVDDQGKDYLDNAQRFAALCHAGLLIAEGRSNLPVPQLVHGHDWHAGLLPWLMKRRGLPQPAVMTIHNLAFQGQFDASVLPSIGLSEADRNDPTLEYWGGINLLKAGLANADRITTVSERYAKEVLTPQFGHGLDGLLRSLSERLSAIRNGVDDTAWNPANDPLIERPFTADDLGGKASCKRHLQEVMGLAIEPFAPLLSLGNRITPQKMSDVALPVLASALHRYPRLQVAVIGRGDPRLEQGFRQLAQAWPGRVGVFIGYNERIAHELHAGADMLLHGSRFEPFGLTPLYAMRYGSVPIVSRIGGMVDTVTDSRGLLFDSDSQATMLDAIGDALMRYGDLDGWRRMQLAGMRADFGWRQPAQDYLSLYRSLQPAIGEPMPIKAQGRPLRAPSLATSLATPLATSSLATSLATSATTARLGPASTAAAPAPKLPLPMTRSPRRAGSQQARRPGEGEQRGLKAANGV